MKFNEYVYERPNTQLIQSTLEKLTHDLVSAANFELALKAVNDYHNFIDEIDSTFQLALIRHSMNTKDEFYDQEKEFFNETMPLIDSYSIKFTNSLLESQYRGELELKLGTLLFKKAELSKKTFSDSVIELLQKENRLTTEYVKLKSSAQIEFKGGIYNLSQMQPFVTSKNRQVRKEATITVSKWYKNNSKGFDEIYDNLINVRHEIAIKLGYENFIQLGYDRLKRVDYDANDVMLYRNQVLKYLVPFVEKLEQRKSRRLNIKDMKSYDLGLNFLTGNPNPKGDLNWQVSKAQIMYDLLSPETSEFFNYMVDKELLDLESRESKEGGGYCTYIPKYESPFIFANFNGTSGDVDVLTHEAGHAFQVYTSRKLIPEYRWPGYESAEIHSMSMEFLAWPYIHLFFEEDTEKYKFSHLSGGIEFLPYGVLVDHFQHEVYKNPTMSPDERKQTWNRLEKIYQPWKVYDEEDPMNEGLWWYKQGHIFQDPFYYIDYTLAQVIAFYFWGINQKDAKETWYKYYELCKLGGAYSFVELLNKANLPNPFKEGTINKILEPIKAYLDKVDDLDL